MSKSAQASGPMPEGAQSPSLMIAPDEQVQRGLRVFVFYSFALLLTGPVSMLFADLLWRSGWSGFSTILLVLFIVLFFFSAIGCVTAIYGFILRLLGDGQRITRLNDYKTRTLEGTSTAIIFPIY